MLPIHQPEGNGRGGHICQPALRQLRNEESPIRDYLWGVVIVLMGVFTVFGYWFLFAG